MSSQEPYQNCNLIGDADPRTKDGQGYWVVVEPEDATAESDRLFAEGTFITGTAIAIKYGSRNSDAIPELKKLTFAKARARIALGLYDHGKEYLQEITSKTLRSEVKSVEDEYIQRWLLTGLLNIRKKNPLRYKLDSIDVGGFCGILGITEKQYLFNASILLEDGLINHGETNELTIENGGMYITSEGVKQLSFLTARRVELKGEARIRTEVAGNLEVEEEFKYDVAISFAGEDREIAEQLAKELESRDIEVFYDDFEQETLWGKNLYEHLDYVYGKASRYCIMLLSKHYAEKTWTNHERKSAQARAFRQRTEYILPIRIDNTKIPGLAETVGYISLKNTSVENIVDLIMKKLAALP